MVLALVLLLSCMSFAAAEEEITLNVWSFTNELEGMINKYYAPTHPNVKIQYTLYPTDGGEYTSKVDAIMASAATSDEAPDVFTLEAAFVKKYVNSDVTANLADVGITEEEVAAAIPVMKQIGTSNINGQLKGLSWQATPGALMYRASLAEKYLGVTTPEEFQAKVAAADDAKKAAIKDFILFFTMSEDFLYQYALDSGDFVGSNAVVNKVLENGGTPNPFLGGQDHYAIFAEAANLANGSIMTDYDETMNRLWDENVTTPYSKGEKDLDTAIADFKAQVTAQFPELVVE